MKQSGVEDGGIDADSKLQGQVEAKSIFQKLNIAGFFLGSVLFMPIGKLTDKIPAY